MGKSVAHPPLWRPASTPLAGRFVTLAHTLWPRAQVVLQSDHPERQTCVESSNSHPFLPPLLGHQGTSWERASKVTVHQIWAPLLPRLPQGPPFPIHSQLKLSALHYTVLCLGWPMPLSQTTVTKRGGSGEMARQGAEHTPRTAHTRRLTGS